MARRRKKPEGVEAYPAPIGPRLDPARKDRKLAALGAARRSSMFRQMKPGVGGLSALAGLGMVGAGYGVAGGVRSLIQRPLVEQAQEDLRRSSRQQLIDQLSNTGRRMSLEDSINRNLMRLEAEAPELYMRVASGRRLPQGAVVLGGEKRTDLLEELGRSMADGQFSM